MRLETEARCQQQVHYLTINLSFTAENQDLREAIDFGPARRGSLCDHGTVYCRQGDYHLHPFYEAYLLKLFSHSHLLLYTEDSVVLKSELIRSRGGVGTREIYWFSEYHTGDYHLSLCIHDYLPLIMNSVLIGSRSLPSFVVLEIDHRRDALY